MNWRSSASQAPLRLFGAALRRARAKRIRRLRLGVFAAAASLPALATLVVAPAPRLVWNASASAPIGLYRVDPGAPIARGDMVIAWAPEPWRTLAAGRHYLPANVPLVKRVAAAQGDLVCGAGLRLTVNGAVVALRLAHDRDGRPLPRWDGCRLLGPGQFLLLMPAPGSFDGRYFGATGEGRIVGRARLIWPR